MCRCSELRNDDSGQSKEFEGQTMNRVSDDIFLGEAYLHRKSNKVMILTSDPDEEHNCDQMGCASGGGHIIAWLPELQAHRQSNSIIEPPQNLEETIKKYDTLDKIIAQLEKLGFGNDIQHNVAFIALKRMAIQAHR